MATLAQRLVEAEAAYHDLLTGKAIARLRDQNGEEIQYSKADIGLLKAYIADLKTQVAAEVSGVTAQTERPMRSFYV